jgi:hypothetical protein
LGLLWLRGRLGGWAAGEKGDDRAAAGVRAHRVGGRITVGDSDSTDRRPFLRNPEPGAEMAMIPGWMPKSTELQKLNG